MSHPGLARDEAADPHIQRRATGDGAGEDLLRQPVGAGEPNEALDSTQRGFLCTALGYRHAVAG